MIVPGLGCGVDHKGGSLDLGLSVRATAGGVISNGGKDAHLLMHSDKIPITEGGIHGHHVQIVEHSDMRYSGEPSVLWRFLEILFGGNMIEGTVKAAVWVLLFVGLMTWSTYW